MGGLGWMKGRLYCVRYDRYTFGAFRLSVVHYFRFRFMKCDLGRDENMFLGERMRFGLRTDSEV
jgi:hypothetical protein